MLSPPPIGPLLAQGPRCVLVAERIVERHEDVVVQAGLWDARGVPTDGGAAPGTLHTVVPLRAVVLANGAESARGQWPGHRVVDACLRRDLALLGADALVATGFNGVFTDRIRHAVTAVLTRQHVARHRVAVDGVTCHLCAAGQEQR